MEVWLKLLNISDDDLTYKHSKWLLEYARIVGCDRFSFDIEEKNTDYALKYQKTLLEMLEAHNLGWQVAKVVVMYNDEPNIRYQRVWTLNHDSIPIILRFMGLHLLDDLTNYNTGISGWRFYKGGEVHACAVYGFDYFYFWEPPEGLVKIIGSSALVGEKHT